MRCSIAAASTAGMLVHDCHDGPGLAAPDDRQSGKPISVRAEFLAHRPIAQTLAADAQEPAMAAGRGVDVGMVEEGVEKVMRHAALLGADSCVARQGQGLHREAPWLEGLELAAALRQNRSFAVFATMSEKPHRHLTEWFEHVEPPDPGVRDARQAAPRPPDLTGDRSG